MDILPDIYGRVGLLNLVYDQEEESQSFIYSLKGLDWIGLDLNPGPRGPKPIKNVLRRKAIKLEEKMRQRKQGW